jgi:hypothetical protein
MLYVIFVYELLFVRAIWKRGRKWEDKIKTNRGRRWIILA